MDSDSGFLCLRSIVFLTSIGKWFMHALSCFYGAEFSMEVCHDHPGAVALRAGE